jgi:hypothetical protein
MTLGRFRRIMDTSGLECRYFATNASDNPVVRTMKVVSHVPPLREYFTQNVYSIWEKHLDLTSNTLYRISSRKDAEFSHRRLGRTTKSRQFHYQRPHWHLLWRGQP